MVQEDKESLKNYLDSVSVTLLGRCRKRHLQKELKKKERRKCCEINYIVFVRRNYL